MTEAAVAGGLIGTTTGASMFAVVNVSDMNVSVMVAVPCTVFICGIVWWLGSRFQKIDDKLAGLQERIESLPCEDCEDCTDKRRNHE